MVNHNMICLGLVCIMCEPNHCSLFKMFYPAILTIFSPFLGEEAKKIYNEAQNLLKSLITENKLKAKGLIGFWPARSIKDDIYLYDTEEELQNLEPIAKFCGLRQQVWLDDILFK